MSRSFSTFTVTLLFFLTFSVTFVSAAPANDGHGKDKYVPSVSSTPSEVANPTSPTNTTVVDNSTNNVVNPTLTTAAQSGTATWFEVGLGACGFENTDSDFIVALSESDWAGGSHCNHQVQITNPANGRTFTATVRDLCPGCVGDGLDLSPGLFKALADDLGLGVFQMTWFFL